MSSYIKINKKKIGEGCPVYITAEIGINHNGDIDIAKKLIDAAVLSGCDAVKFQKRTPDLCVPEKQKNIMRETPWGIMSYLDYRHKIEFGKDEYTEINNYCKDKGIDWFASCWDKPSVDFIEEFSPVAHKICSAALTDDELISYIDSFGHPIILSTGMSTMEQINHAVSLIKQSPLMLLHATSTYPCKISELNLNMITELKEKFDYPIGYSGHEVGIQTTVAAAVLGAVFVERHITLDRAMWGSDQSASVEPIGVMKLVRDIRACEAGLGDGIKKVYDSELPIIERLRLK